MHLAQKLIVLSAAWSPLPATGNAPTTTAQQSMVYDGAKDRMLVFGGQQANGAPSNALHALSLGPTPAWSVLSPTGPLPPARTGHAAIYDSANRRMVIFGGDSLRVKFFNDVWVLPDDGSLAWQPLTVAGTPPPTGFRPADFGG